MVPSPAQAATLNTLTTPRWLVEGKTLVGTSGGDNECKEPEIRCTHHTTLERSSWRGFQTLGGSMLYGFGSVYGCLEGTYDYQTNWYHKSMVPNGETYGVKGVGFSQDGYKESDYDRSGGRFRATCVGQELERLPAIELPG